MFFICLVRSSIFATKTVTGQTFHRMIDIIYLTCYWLKFSGMEVKGMKRKSCRCEYDHALLNCSALMKRMEECLGMLLVSCLWRCEFIICHGYIFWLMSLSNLCNCLPQSSSHHLNSRCVKKYWGSTPGTRIHRHNYNWPGSDGVVSVAKNVGRWGIRAAWAEGGKEGGLIDRSLI